MNKGMGGRDAHVCIHVRWLQEASPDLQAWLLSQNFSPVFSCPRSTTYKKCGYKIPLAKSQFGVSQFFFLGKMVLALNCKKILSQLRARQTSGNLGPTAGIPRASHKEFFYLEVNADWNKSLKASVSETPGLLSSYLG